MDGASQIHNWLASRSVRFVRKKDRAGSIQPARKAEESEKTLCLGNFLVVRVIGQGMGGSVVYLAEHIQTSARVALKWPVRSEEVEVMKELMDGDATRCPGLPRLLASGVQGGKHYLAIELLGPDLTLVLSCLKVKVMEP